MVSSQDENTTVAEEVEAVRIKTEAELGGVSAKEGVKRVF